MKMFSKKLSILTMITLIAITMLISIPSVFAEQGDGQNMGKITLKWHQYDTGKGYYNPADEGKDVSFWYIFGFKGKDTNGNIKSGLYAQRMYNGKIGETKVDEIDLSSVKDQKGNIYTDCEFEGIYLPLYRGGNTKYGGSRDEKPKEITVQFSQNIETHTKMSIEEGAIILEEDLNDMPILFDVEKVGGEYPHKNTNNKNIIKRTVNFKVGDIDLSLDNGRDDYSFYRAITQNNLEMFNPYNNNKKEYKLHANFTGENKAELEERYSLAMSGNDLDGWNLVLKSNIKKGVKEEVTNQDFKTIYEDDPTLPVGKTKVKQKGVKGKTVTKTTYYYIAKEDGKEKIIKTEDPIVEKTEPINEIILRGTKTSTTDKEAKVITFDANGGKWEDNTSIKTLEANKGEEIKILEAPSREGYVFDYWQGSEYHPGDVYKVEDNHTFTAVWKKDSKNPDTNTGENLNKPGEQNQSQNKNTTDNKAPNTGDNQSIYIYFSLILVTAFSVLAIRGFATKE